ncbi:conserved protein of unknown function [Methanocaldococcus lauensis]|uniref:Uncharacterized protein n=1 Tax=Methanocaldococcus lauensis TaxID=2546128 RepID=A0A8D6PWM4_9EURY|nr:hypothetical protein [Methanocaldococcus lauensis]CAB3289975.1 conserved protein of unknown function [Methanocaldococcus lauensis]
MTINSYKKLMENRNLHPLHIILTSFLGELANLRLLNQGTTNIIGSNVGKKVGQCVIDLGYKIPNNDEELIKFFIDIFQICDEVFIKSENNTITIGIKIDKCKYCPKQIGEAEIPGSACPIPSLISSFLEKVKNKKYKIKFWNNTNQLIKKEDGHCWFIIFC